MSMSEQHLEYVRRMIRALHIDDDRLLLRHGKYGAVKEFAEIEGTLSIDGATDLVVTGAWNPKTLESNGLGGAAHVLGTSQGTLIMAQSDDLASFGITPEFCASEDAADVVFEVYGTGDSGAFTWDVLFYDMDDATTAIITDSITFDNASDDWHGLDALTAGIGNLLVPGKTYAVQMIPDDDESSTVKKWRVRFRTGVLNQA